MPVGRAAAWGLVPGSLGWPNEQEALLAGVRCHGEFPLEQVWDIVASSSSWVTHTPANCCGWYRKKRGTF